MVIPGKLDKIMAEIIFLISDYIFSGYGATRYPVKEHCAFCKVFFTFKVVLIGIIQSFDCSHKILLGVVFV